MAVEDAFFFDTRGNQLPAVILYRCRRMPAQNGGAGTASAPLMRMRTIAPLLSASLGRGRSES